MCFQLRLCASSYQNLFFIRLIECILFLCKCFEFMCILSFPSSVFLCVIPQKMYALSWQNLPRIVFLLFFLLFSKQIMFFVNYQICCVLTFHPGSFCNTPLNNKSQLLDDIITQEVTSYWRDINIT